MNRVIDLFKIQYPIIQAGMVWVSGAKLAAASANAGILGLIGAGSMKPELLEQHIQKAHSLTNKAFGVNIPLLYKDVEKQIDVCLENKISIFFTSAGSPKKYTKYLKDNGATVCHVTSSAELAKKCEDAGVDAVVAEGFEAGGHNGRDETTTLNLIPAVKAAVKIPVIAAGGIGLGKQMAAAVCLGADGVQIGSRFVTSTESSAHLNFKNAVIQSKMGDTQLTLKELVPVRLLKNKFFKGIIELEEKYPDSKQLQENLLEYLGKGRAKQGMLLGDLEQGELEIGQVAGLIRQILPTQAIVNEIVTEFKQTQEYLSSF